MAVVEIVEEEALLTSIPLLMYLAYSMRRLDNPESFRGCSTNRQLFFKRNQCSIGWNESFSFLTSLESTYLAHLSQLEGAATREGAPNGHRA